MTDDLAGQYIEHKEDRKLGHGYNKFTASPSASPAVVGNVGQPREGQGVSSGIDTITEVTELHQSLGIDVDVSGSYMGASASAKMKYAREFDSSTYSMYVVIWVRVDDSFREFDEPALHRDATDLLQTKNSGRFHERFGDYWISGVSYGGEFFATYQITATSQEQREEMAAEVHAAYNGVVASVALNASIDSKSKDAQNRVEVRLVEFREGAVTHADLHARSLDRGAHDSGGGGLEDGVERGGEVRSAVADQEPDALEPLDHRMDVRQRRLGYPKSPRRWRQPIAPDLRQHPACEPVV